jgi:hypothetical protein
VFGFAVSTGPGCDAAGHVSSVVPLEPALSLFFFPLVFK